MTAGIMLAPARAPARALSRAPARAPALSSGPAPRVVEPRSRVRESWGPSGHLHREGIADLDWHAVGLAQHGCPAPPQVRNDQLPGIGELGAQDLLALHHAPPQPHFADDVGGRVI